MHSPEGIFLRRFREYFSEYFRPFVQLAPEVVLAKVALHADSPQKAKIMTMIKTMTTTKRDANIHRQSTNLISFSFSSPHDLWITHPVIGLVLHPLNKCRYRDNMVFPVLEGRKRWICVDEKPDPVYPEWGQFCQLLRSYSKLFHKNPTSFLFCLAS